jgi:hypothetical protein
MFSGAEVKAPEWPQLLCDSLCEFYVVTLIMTTSHVCSCGNEISMLQNLFGTQTENLSHIQFEY